MPAKSALPWRAVRRCGAIAVEAREIKIGLAASIGAIGEECQ